MCVKYGETLKLRIMGIRRKNISTLIIFCTYVLFAREHSSTVSLQRTPPLSPICLSFERGQKICIYLCLHLGNAEKIFLLCKHTIENVVYIIIHSKLSQRKRPEFFSYNVDYFDLQSSVIIMCMNTG